MKLYIDFDIENFEAWSGGKDTKESIINAGKAGEFNALVDDIFQDGCTETEMNDYLWFDSESIFEMLGLDEDGNEPSEDEDEEPADVSGYDDFESFCNSFGSSCEGCPFRSPLPCDCESLFDEAKKEA
jgi:hypothetical protein